MNNSRKTVPPPAFDRALNRFRGSLSDEEKKIFHHLTSEKEVWSLVEELQNEQGSRDALRNMNRIEPFINGMAQYASVIEVFLQAKPEIMALVWGPLKLLLQLANNFTESFDRVLDAIERIGENLPRFRRFSAIFSYSDQIQHVISLIYEDIMDFYRRALKFFRRRAWKIVFSLTWDSFENRFGLILNNLQRHQSLVDNEARAEEIEQAHTARQEALKQFKVFQERNRNERMMAIFDWLNPTNIEADKDKVITKKSPGTGNWLHEAKEIKEWIQGKRKFIWLTGIPGSGKTILSFSILEHLEMEKKSTDSSRPILYFFCGYSQAHRNTSLAILRTFIYQIVNQDNDLLPYVYREWMNDHHSHSSVSKLKNLFCNLLETSVTASEHAYIIVDGLDELPDNERREFLLVLKALRSKAPFNSITRIFVASRNLSDIRTGLSTLKATDISIEGNNTDDIHRYIECETQRVGEQFGLETEMREFIADSLRTRADGMFLWVHLIIESLLTQTTIKGIRETLGDLPKGLDQAYERILLRIKSLPPHAQEQANKILDWLTCGFRPLKVSELEDAFAISPGDPTVDGDNRPFRDGFRFLCGPIIELTDQDTVVFVHFSAKEYLLSRYSGPFINRWAAHLNISLICITYQCFRCFEPALSSDMVAKSVLNGDLRLFAYVQSSWLEHVREFCKLCPHDREQIERLSLALRDLFRRRNASLTPNFLSPGSSGPNSHQTFSSETLSKIQDFSCLEPDLKGEFMRILEYRKNLERKLSTLGAGNELMNWSNKNNPLTVDQGGRVLQQVMEDLLHGNSQLPTPINLEKLRKLYGTNLYKCRYQFCQMFSGEGFATLDQRQSHEEKHDRLYRCQEQGCIYHDRGFKSKSHLRKHMKDYHTVMAIGRQSTDAVEALQKALIDGEEEDGRQSIFSLLDSKSVGEGSGTALNNENLVASDMSLESFELTNQLSGKTEFLDRILVSRAPPPLPDPDQSASLMMVEIQEIIDSCVDRFLDPGLVTDPEGIENSQIEIVLLQLSSQLKSWKKLVQSFYIVSQNRLATEQLIFNVLHCREQYSDNFETPKGRYTATVSALKKTRERLGRCYLYIRNAAKSDSDKEGYQILLRNEELSHQELAEQEKRRTAMAKCEQLRVAERNRLQNFPDPASLDKVDQDWVQIVTDELKGSQISQGWQKELTIAYRVKSVFEIACLWQVAMAENELAGYLDLTMIIEQAKSTENLVYRKSKSKEKYQRVCSEINALQTYQLELVLREQQNKRRLAMARTEQDQLQELPVPQPQPQPPQPASQPLSLSQLQENQRLFQIVLHNLKQNWNPQGWQQEMTPTERATSILQMFIAKQRVRAFSLKLARTGVDQTVAILIATTFERYTYEKSRNKGEYRVTCRAKLLQIRESRKRQLAAEEIRMRGGRPLVSPQPVIEPPPILGQDQDMSVSPDEMAVRNLQHPPEPNLQPFKQDATQDTLQENLTSSLQYQIYPSQLTPLEFAAFHRQDLSGQREFIQRYLSAQNLLQINRIDPDQLTAEQFTSFQIKEQPSQYQYIQDYISSRRQAVSMGSQMPLGTGIAPEAYTRQLLMANGIEPNRLTPQQFEAFQNQDPATQQKSISLYLAAYASGKVGGSQDVGGGIGGTPLSDSEASQVHELLWAGGVDSGRLTPMQLELFQNQSPRSQQMIIQHYIEAGYGSKTASTLQSPGGEASSDVYSNQQNQSTHNSPVMTQTSEDAPLAMDYHYDQPSDEVPDSLKKYLDEVKKYFAQIPGKYSQFLEILSVYKSCGTSENEVYRRIGVNFGVTPEFLKGFKIAWSKYGTESWKLALEKALLDQSTQLAMKEKEKLSTPAEPKSSFGISEAERDFWYSTPPPQSPTQPTSHSTSSHNINQYPSHSGPQNEQLLWYDELYQLKDHSTPPPMSGPPEAMSDTDGPENDPFYGIMDGVFGS